MIIQIFENQIDRHISYVCFAMNNSIKYFEFNKMILKKEITLEYITKNYTGESCFNHAKSEFFDIAKKQIDKILGY